METSTKKRLSPAVLYFLAGFIAGWPALLATASVYPEWRLGYVSSPLSLAAIHVLILGGMLTIAFGVLYQIIPIAFQAPPNPRHILYWHLPLHLFAVLLMALGFLKEGFVWVGIGGTLLIILTLAFFLFVLKSYRKARNKTIVHRSLLLPFFSLALVLVIGIFQAFWPSDISPGLLASHVLFGGLAFWVGLVLVLSYKLIPMFVISHGYKASLTRTSSFYFTGVLLFIVSAWMRGLWFTGASTAGSLCILVGLASFITDVIAIVRARKKRRVVAPMYDAFLATAVLILGVIGIVVGGLLSNLRVLVDTSFVLLLGGLLPLMFSYLQKMVPFLWFEYRFSKRPERKSAPLIDDMVSRPVAQTGFAIYYIGFLIGILTLTIIPQNGAGVTAIISALLLFAGSATIWWALRAVLRIGGTRPDD